MTTTRKISALAAMLVLLLGVFSLLGLHSAHASTVPSPTLGLYQSSENSGSYPVSWEGGQHPDLANTYLYWGNSVNAGFLTAADNAGSTPFIEIEPWHGNGPSDCSISMANIASNNSATQSYAKGIGTAIANSGHPVIVTFAHEPNVSGQYPWAVGGCESNVTQWVNAWKSVVNDIRSTAGGNAFFMWAPNADTGGSTQNPAPWWPGTSYVDMVGVDGYPQSGSGWGLCNFSQTFGQSFTDIRNLGWNSGIFIAETNLSPLDTSASCNGQSYEHIPQFMTDMYSAGGTGILEWDDTDSGATALTSQQWSEVDAAVAAHKNSSATGYILNTSLPNGQVMDNKLGTTANGNTVQTWNQGSGVRANEQWTVTPVPGQSYDVIKYAANPSYCLDVKDYGTANGTKLQLWQCNGGVDQEWKPSGSQLQAVYATQQTGHAMVLDDPSTTGANGTALEIDQANGSAAQNWNVP